MRIAKVSPLPQGTNTLPTAPIPEDLKAVPIQLTENARTILRKRYLRRGEDGQPAETEHQMFWRVAYHVALAEAEFADHETVMRQARAYFELLTKLRFFPNSPTFTGAGTPLGQLAACFTAKMRVTTIDGLKPISELREGDMVLTHRGRYRPVRAAYKRDYDDTLLTIKIHNIGTALEVTPEHPILTPDGWVEAGALKVGDWVALGALEASELLEASLAVAQTADASRAAVAFDFSKKTVQESNSTYRQIESIQAERYTGTVYNCEVEEDNTYVTEGIVVHNCFVLAIDDDMGRTENGIFQTLRNAALIQQTGGGNGFAFSRLRPKGALVRSSGGEATGPVGFLRVYDQAFGEIAQGGCLTPETLVFTERGLLRLDEIVTHRTAGWREHSLMVATDEGQRHSPSVYNNGIKPVLRVQTDEGLILRGTPDHKVKVLTASGLVWRRLDELQAGDALVVKLGQHCGTPQRLQTSNGESVALDRDVAYQIGRFLGGAPISASLLALLTFNGIHQDEIPRCIRQSTPETVLAFLDGLRDLPVAPSVAQQSRVLALGVRTLAAQPILAGQTAVEDDVLFTRVVAVEPDGESLTLDLEVEGNHTYLANGIVTHNSRRGANMAVLRVDHPDIREFITCKTDESAITNFNISVGITDAFMRAVENDEDFELVNPQDGKVWERVRARDLFDLIVKQAHHNGEPGVLFLDTANRSNPVPHLYELESTNPCVTGDTLVATPSGWRRADSIQEGDEICTVLGTGRVATVEINEAVPVFDVHFSDGGTIRVTAAHQFHVRDSRSKFFEPRRVDELKIGDWVRVYRAAMPNNPVPQGSVPLEDRQYGFLVGVLVGDGTFTPIGLPRNVVRVSSHADEHEWNEIVINALKAVGVERVTTYVMEGSRSIMMDPKPGRVIASWVRSLPLKPALSREKELPECYINSNREFLIGLLDGLFSTDGSVDLSSNHPIVRFHTASPKLAEQVRRILLMFGVHGRIFKTIRKRHDINGRHIRNDRPKYDVVISGESFGRFFEQIRLSHPEKQRRMEEAALKCNFTGGNWAARVVKIEPAGVERVYDLYEPRSDTWITNGYVSRGCGEQWLGPFENCCLGSLNLAQLPVKDGAPDWKTLQAWTELATRFLDDVVSANSYVPSVPQLAEAAHRVRRIGLGFMGLADLMYKLRVRYGSEEGQEFAGQITEFIRYHAMKTSIELAKERGAFPAIKGSIYDPDDLKWQPPTPLFPYTRDWKRPKLDWEKIVKGIKKHGIRNGAQLTVAPTGCLVAGSLLVTDQGILPIEQLGDPHGAQWQDIAFNVASEGSAMPATHFYVNGRAQTLKITTKRGYTLQGTLGHRIRVWHDGTLEWRRMDELQVGMRVPLQATGLIGAPKAVPLSTDLISDFHTTPLTLPAYMTADLAYLIGFFMGDGSLKKRSLRFCTSDEATEMKLTELLHKVFGVVPTVAFDKRTRTLKSLEVHSVNLVAFWRRNGFAKIAPSAEHYGKGYRPHIPLAVLRTNDESIYAAFLAGLFDADGTARRLLTWLTTDRQFHDQVKVLMLAMGILTTTDLQTTGLGRSTAYRLRTAHVEATRRLIEKLPYLCRAVPTAAARRQTLCDGVPITPQQHRQVLQIARRSDAYARVQGWKQRGYQVSRHSLAQFVASHRNAMLMSGLESLVATVDDDIYFDEIVAIEDGGWQETYDISVPGTHAYIANGLISHNTIATVSGCEGYGCEPVFALAYIRHVNDKGRDLQLQYTSPLFEQALHEAKLSEDQIKRIIEHVNLYGSCQQAPDLPDHIRHTFVVSSDITPEEHIRMQAAIQRFVDNSISKCVTGETLVLTAQGLTPIADLSEMRLPDQFEALTIDVVTPYGTQKTDAFYYGGRRETRKIRLTYGYEIEGTPNHRIHALGEDGQIRFARLDELKIGDTVVLYAGQQIFGEAGQPLPPLITTAARNAKQIRLPERMSVELAYLLGCVISEGAITRNGVTITNGDRSLLERLGGLFTQLFGLTWHIARDMRRESVYSLQVNSRQLRDWLILSLNILPGARNKTIPTPILRASRSELSAFLRGLFLDAYMTRDGRMFGIGLANRKLLRQLQVILLNCGIFSRLQRASGQAWALTISGNGLERLAALVEFDEVWKNERIAVRSEGQLHVGDVSTIRSTHGAQALSLTVEQERLYVRVERIESGFAEVFDLSVPQSHTFIANGLGNHNTCNFPSEATEQDVATAYMLGWKLGCKGLTVYVTGSREKVVLETHATAKQKEKGDEAQPEATTTALTAAQSHAVTPNGDPEPITLFPEPKKPRPRRLEGRTYRIGTPLGGTYITINENGEGRGQPFEMFIHTSKAGSETAAISEALGRLSSLIMRMASPIPPRERVKEIIRQLEGIGGDRSIGFGPQRVRSLPDGIAQVLREYLDETSDDANDPAPLPKRYIADQRLLEQPKAQLELMGELCPECGEASLVNEEGCRKCYSCGYSEC